jgi:hypothetical protein
MARRRDRTDDTNRTIPQRPVTTAPGHRDADAPRGQSGSWPRIADCVARAEPAARRSY